MARLIGPSEASREVKTIVTSAGSTRGLFKSKALRPATYYTTSAADVLADVVNLDSTPIPGSTVTIDSYSMLPLMQFPDGVDVVYVRVDGGPAWPVYAREDDQIDALEAAIAALQGDVGAAETPAGAQAKADAAQSAAISAAATDATSKSDAAQAAAISAAASDATSRVATEATTRASADTALAGLITAEATSRASGDTTAIAAAVQRANHTGTQSADTLVDGTTNKAYTAAEKTKLAGVATGATANSADATLLDRASHTGTQPSSTISDFTEAAQDAIAALIGAGPNITVTYDDNANSLVITGADGVTDPEVVRDAIGAALVGVGPINITVNDVADTITITSTATANSTDAALRDRSTHTGTQSADTVVDGTTNKAFLATERTKLAGIATGATANATDAQLRDRSTHTGTQPISTIAALQAALDAKVDLPGVWFNVQKQPGIAYDGVTDDSVAYRTFLATIPAAAGNEVGGIGIAHPHGVMLLNTPDADGYLASIVSKGNVQIVGTGSGSRIRTSSGTTEEMFRFETCTNLNVRDIMLQLIGTAHVKRALHDTTASPGSSHFNRFQNVTISCNGSFRNVGDIGCTLGSATIYSALAAFGAGDVGGFITIDLSTGPFTSTIQSVNAATATLAAPLAASSAATTLTLTTPISGAPASGFTLPIGNERVFVSAGGNTTSLTVARGRGPDILVEAHSAGDTVTLYSAVLADNLTLSVSNAVAPGRIQPPNSAIMENGFCLGVDHLGASNIDLANTNIDGLVVIRAAVAGMRVGNGTSGNNLDHWGKGVTILESGYGVYMNAGAFSIHGGDFDNNLIDIRRIGVCSSPVKISDIRSESSYGWYSYTGSATIGTPTTLDAINIVTCYAEDGVPLRHVNSGSLTIDGFDVSGSLTVRGNLLAVIAGTAASPCHVTATNVTHSGATGDFFASVGVGAPGVRTAIKNIFNQARKAANGVVEVNTVVCDYIGGHTIFAGGFARTPTIVNNVNYQILKTDMKVVYQTLTATRTTTLPAFGSTLPAGNEHLVMDGSGNCSGAVKIIVTTSDGKLINGAATHEIITAYGRGTYFTDGTQWLVQS